MNQEQRDEDMVDEMSQEVDSRGEVIRIEIRNKRPVIFEVK